MPKSFKTEEAIIAAALLETPVRLQNYPHTNSITKELLLQLFTYKIRKPDQIMMMMMMMTVIEMLSPLDTVVAFILVRDGSPRMART
ncbi:hypothetical protein EVAR_53776_1 [Eumeta japonica]|uniref:Uncharacterized protein n=1 Tax=Eumeta variegata TaxID=151549 RepID=A0A4C1Z1U6_EUMVA|nr:hypothetical protein EVAR_53776_1 [Eumeta japonica]